MFVNLFISRWRHPDAAVRIQAVTKLNPSHPADLEKLWQLVMHDPDLDVQTAAVFRLEAKDKLFELLDLEGQTQLIDRAAFRLTELFEAQQLSVSDFYQLSQQTLTALLCHSPNSSLHDQLLNQIDQQDLLAELAMRSPLANTRQLAVKALQHETLIDRVRAYAKEHDKVVYRIIRDQQKLKQQQAVKHIEAERQCGQLLSQLSELLHQESAQHLSARIDHIDKQWQALSTHANADQHAQFEHVRQSLKAIIEAQHLHALALEEKAARVDALAARLVRFEQSFKQYLGVFNTVDALQTETLDELKNELNQLMQSELNTQQAQQCDLYAQLMDRCFCFSDQLVMLNTLTENAEEAFKDQPPNEQHVDSVLEKIHRLQKSFADWPAEFPAPGHLQDINNLYLTVRQKRQAIREQSQAEAELKQQQHQSVITQKEHLCVAMEALSDIEWVPSEKAQQIRSLQQQWKQLDNTTPVSVKALWDRFHKASKIAYAPCEEHFREQSRLRAWNLSQREQICQLIEAYFDSLDWSQLDWSALELILKKAKTEWREFSPVDRAPGKPLQARFNGLVKRADDALNQHRRACEEAKQALIDEATQLAQVPDSEFAPATQRLKELQSEWKQIGAAEHLRERQLWKAFREQGDRLFTRLRAQKQDAHQSDEEIDARLLCVRLEILLNLPSPEADQYLRMEYQMERLEEALETPSMDEQSKALVSLKLEWQESGFADLYPELSERFQFHLSQINLEQC